MAGQPKKGLEFAGWDVRLFDDDERIDELIAAQDWVGFSIYFYIVMKGYATNGYYFQYKDNSAAITARRMGGSVKLETVNQVVSLCLQIGLFDKRLFDREKILTNKEMQTRYMLAVEKRSLKGRTVNSKYWLLDSDETKAYINIPENDNSLPENDIKESKVKKSKVNESKDFVSSAALQSLNTDDYFIALVLNNGDYYLVRHKAICKYKELYPAVDVEQELRKMCGWLESNPKNRKTRNGIKAFITKWLARTQDRGGIGYGGQPVTANNRQVSDPGTTSGYQTKNIL